jgi:acetolactate decarboxylase
VSVRWIGAQRDVLGGDVEGKVELRSLAPLTHLYALGPRAGVTGEITIFDGEPCVAQVVDGRIQVEARFDHAACFLVYDEVPAWQESILARPIDGEAALTAAVLDAARAARVDVDEPLIFLLRAPAATVTFHVLDKRDDLPHTPALHDQAKVRFRVDRQAAEVLGFYSSRHHGIFTPRDSNLHMHLRTLDGRSSGHVEQIAVDAGTVIAVSRKGAP